MENFFSVKIQGGNQMNRTEPIRKAADIEKFKNYYRFQKNNSRNYLMIVIGLNTALRVSDMLQLTWGDVYDFTNNRYKEHIRITEQKTGKYTQIYINDSIIKALKYRMSELKKINKTCKAKDYLFRSKKRNLPICRVQADRIIKEAAKESGITSVVSCHSLRKTFGYRAWKNGIEEALLVNIFNHSTYNVTKRYLGIDQDEKDEVFKNINI